MKVLAVMFVLFAYCYCIETQEKAVEVLVEDSRATKKKKNNFRMLAMIALFIFSKMAVFKVVSFMMLMTFFQKLFTLVGAFLGFYMNKKTPTSTYGPPADYNTVGYSYGPPDADKTFGPAGEDYGLPSLTDIGGTFNSWLFNKHNY